MSVDDSFTKSLLHFNGVDASTTFTDESGKVWTAQGDAKISTVQSVFGGASGYFDGIGDYITTPDHADFVVGSDDFTVDMRVKKAANNITYRILGQCDAPATASKRSIEIILTAENLVFAYLSYSGGNKSTITVGTIDTNWHHIALVRYGNSAKLYIDGTTSGTPADMTGITLQDSDQVFAIGALGLFTDNRYNGYVDEFRFSKGIARWTSNFTPPTQEYTPGPPGVKTINGVAIANVKTINGVAVADIKSLQGLTFAGDWLRKLDIIRKGWLWIPNNKISLPQGI